jgi:hypothetical protein
MAEPRVGLTVLSTIGVWLVSILLAWGVVQTRVAVLEERVDQLRADLVEIKTDIKILLRRGQ